METKYYVYVYLDPRKSEIFKYGEYEFVNEPFYVGMSFHENRMNQHIIESFRNNMFGNQMKLNKIRKIIKETNKNPITIIFKNNLSKDEAIDTEKKMIEIIGRKDLKKGPLTNLTDGGEGQNNLSEKSKKSKSLKIKKLWRYNKGYRDIISLKNKIRKTGKIITEEQKEKTSKSIKELWKNDKSFRRKTIKGIRKASGKISQSLKEKWKNEKFPLIGRTLTDEQKKYISERTKLFTPRGENNFNNKWIYYVYDKIMKMIIETFSWSDIKRFCIENNIKYNTVAVKLQKHNSYEKNGCIFKRIRKEIK